VPLTCNNDIGFVDICNNYIAYYSSVNVGTNIPIIITNLSLYGLKKNNYIANIISVSGTILQASLPESYVKTRQ
jgi:hypothetical protein